MLKLATAITVFGCLKLSRDADLNNDCLGCRYFVDLDCGAVSCAYDGDKEEDD